FRIHPMVQSAVVRVEDRGFPAAFALPERWIWSDEWYEFGPPLVEGLRTVLRVDESSYDPTRIWPGQHAAGMAAARPVAYDDAHYLAHLYGGLWWAATGRGLADEAGEPPPAR